MTETDNYIAWMRYVNAGENTRIVVCNSDTPRAFKVYRHPDTTTETLAALKAALASLRAWNVLGVPEAAKQAVADAYENSPEMAQIKRAIANTETK